MEKGVVFTNLGPGPEVIKDGETGLLCNPHNSQDIANKIYWILHDFDLAIEMDRKARQSVVEQFNVDVIVK